MLNTSNRNDIGMGNRIYREMHSHKYFLVSIKTFVLIFYAEKVISEPALTIQTRHIY